MIKQRGVSVAKKKIIKENETRRMIVTLPPYLRQPLEKKAEEMGTSQGDVIRVALTKFLGI